MNLLFLGDSLTDCGRLFDRQGLGDGYVRMIQTTLKTSFSDLSILNRGVDGFTVSRVYGMWKSLPERQKSSFEIVSILVGVNDAAEWMSDPERQNTLPESMRDFAGIYEDLVTDILDYGIPRIVLMEPFIFSCPQEFLLWRPVLAEISASIQKIAKTYRLDFLPLQKALDQAAEKEGFSAVTLDGVHLTKRGNELIAREWTNALFGENLRIDVSQ